MCCSAPDLFYLVHSSPCSLLLSQMSGFPSFYGLLIICDGLFMIYVSNFYFSSNLLMSNFGFVHILANLSNSTINMEVLKTNPSTDFISLGYIPSSGMTGLYDNFIFNCWRKSYTVFHNEYTNLHYHEQCTNGPFCSHHNRYLLSLVILITVILTCLSDISLWV